MNLPSPRIVSLAILSQFMLHINRPVVEACQNIVTMTSAVKSRSMLSLSTMRHTRSNWPITMPPPGVKSLLGFRYDDVLALNVCDALSSRGQSRLSTAGNGEAERGTVTTPRNGYATRTTLAFIPASSGFRARSIMPVEQTPTQQNRHFQRYFSPHTNRKQYNTNRYERFRRCLLSFSRDDTLDYSSSTNPTLNHDDLSNNNDTNNNLMDVGKRAMEVISSNRRSFNRTWNRMEPLIELIVRACGTDDMNTSDTDKKRGLQPKRRRTSSIADVGCDHGILSLSLACMAWAVSQQRNDEDKENESCTENSSTGSRNHELFFTRVIGSDVSSQALNNGGLVSLKKLMDAMPTIIGSSECTSENEDSLPIEFRVGCGLEPLHPGEADAVVLAGMGVHTMLDILFGKNHGDISISDTTNAPPVDLVQTRKIFLQPTNSRPQHMMILYDRIQKSGEWVLRDERIAFVGGRWYTGSFFERGCNNGSSQSESSRDLFRFPGHFLVQEGTSDDNDAYDSYVKHHLQWLKEIYEGPKCSLEDDDMRWMKYIISAEENHRWKNLASWYNI